MAHSRLLRLRRVCLLKSVALPLMPSTVVNVLPLCRGSSLIWRVLQSDVAAVSAAKSHISALPPSRLHNDPPEAPHPILRPAEMQNAWHFRGIVVQRRLITRAIWPRARGNAAKQQAQQKVPLAISRKRDFPNFSILCALTGSNRRPAGCKPAALPAELKARTCRIRQR